MLHDDCSIYATVLGFVRACLHSHRQRGCCSFSAAAAVVAEYTAIPLNRGRGDVRVVRLTIISTKGSSWVQRVTFLPIIQLAGLRPTPLLSRWAPLKSIRRPWFPQWRPDRVRESPLLGVSFARYLQLCHPRRTYMRCFGSSFFLPPW